MILLCAEGARKKISLRLCAFAVKSTRAVPLYALIVLLGSLALAGRGQEAVLPAAGLTTDNSQLTTPADWRDLLAGRRPLRVGLVMCASTLQLVPDGAFRMESEDGISRAGEAGETVSFSGRMKDKVALVPEEGKGWAVKINSGPAVHYRGKMEVFASLAGAGITLVNVLSLEDYIAGVVAKEMGPNFCLEAQRAQAIAARTYALHYLSRHQADGFDICGGVHCQAFTGDADDYGRAKAAAFSTRGQILLYKGKPARTLYHSTCGGETASGQDFDPDPENSPYLGKVCDGARSEDGDEQYLSSQPDSFCRISPRYRWEINFSAAQVDALMAKNLGSVLKQPGLQPGEVKSLRVAEKSGRRAKGLEVKCEAGTFLVEGNAIRWLFRGEPLKARYGESTFSTSGLPSTLFTLSVKKDAAGNPAKYTFTGGGWGHGTGMCQYGAEGRARKGQRAAEILAAYYPGTELTANNSE